MKSHLFFIIFVTAIVIALFTMNSCVIQRNPVTGKKRAYAYSWSQEVQIGQNADQQIQSDYGNYSDQDLQNYVNKIGQIVLKNSHLRRSNTPEKFKETPFTFRVLNSPVVNAFALPGGYIYVTRGLLAHLENEAQLAVVLGHEIGHVAARHASQQELKQKVGQIALIGGAIAGQEVLGISGQDILNLGGTAAKLLFLRYSRDDEREADRLGVEYAAMAGYHTASASKFFVSLKRISQKSGQNLPSLLSTHPDPGNREKSIIQESTQWEKQGYPQKIVNRDNYLNEMNDIVYGDNPREGFSKNGYFFHPDLKFKFPVPKGWNIMNQASRISLISPKQNAIILLQIDRKSQTPEQAVRTIITDNKLNILESKSFKNHPFQPYQVMANITTQEGQQFNFFIYALLYQNRIYVFTDYSAKNDFATFFPDFENTALKFDSLTDHSILSIKPLRIHIIKTTRSGTFKSFLPQNMPENITDADLAILNQVNLNDTIKSGSKIKLPEK